MAFRLIFFLFSYYYPAIIGELISLHYYINSRFHDRGSANITSVNMVFGRHEDMQQNTIDIRELKKLVYRLPKGESMREAILAAPDFISRIEFEIKSDVWRRLL